MHMLAQQFFTGEEQQQITRTIHAVEQQTTGEIVPMVVSSSHAYPEAVITGAALLALPAGRLADRMVRTRLLAIACLLWAVATLLCGLAVSFWMLALARMAVAVSESPTTSTSMSAASPAASRTEAAIILCNAHETRAAALMADAMGGLAGTRFAPLGPD